MNTYSIMNLSLLCSTAFFAASALLLLIDKMKSKKLIFRALEKQNKLYETLFITREQNLREQLGEDLSTQLNACIAEIISIEKKAYKTLSLQFAYHHPEALDSLPSTLNQIIEVYLSCISQVVTFYNKQMTEKDQIGIHEGYKFNALIEELRLEKQNSLIKYAHAMKLLNLIYSKYKKDMGLEEVKSLENLTPEEVASIFKIENMK